MTFSGYPRYQQTAVSWLPIIPEHWALARLKSLVTIRKQISGDLGRDVLSITQRGLKVRDVESNDGQLSMDYSKYQVVQQGDFAMNHMDLLTGWIAIATQAGVTSPDYRVFFLNRSGEVDPHYLLRYLQMGYRDRLFFPLGQGSSQLGRWRLPSEAFHEFAVPIPPLLEQQAITAFLDRETAKIDALIEEQQRLITVLVEKRQAVVSRAVTKGVDPSVPMKDTGIEWLGEVPAHWAVSALSYRYQVQLGKMLDAKRISGEHLQPYLRNTDVQWWRINKTDLPKMDFAPDEVERFLVRKGDILVCEGGEVGRAAIWEAEDSNVFYQKALHRIRPLSTRADLPTYLCYLFEKYARGEVFTGPEGKATIVHLPAEKLRRYRFPFPPLDEQAAIVDHLNEECGSISSLTTVAREAIKLLQERRSALISAAVTGKIDVRGLVEEQAEAA